MLFEEALRVSDVSFLLVEASGSVALVYRSSLEEEEALDAAEIVEPEIPTVIGQTDSIPETPLPRCWFDCENGENGDSENESTGGGFRPHCCRGELMSQNCGKEW
jgi:hypothetical protein